MPRVVSKITVPGSREGSATTSTLVPGRFWRRQASTAAAAAKPAGPSKPAAATGAKALAPVSKPSTGLAPRHPNLGLAPIDVASGRAATAEKIRGELLKISAGALEAAVKAAQSSCGPGCNCHH